MRSRPGHVHGTAPAQSRTWRPAGERFDLERTSGDAFDQHVRDEDEGEPIRAMPMGDFCLESPPFPCEANRHCARCGCCLSRYNSDPLCKPCLPVYVYGAQEVARQLVACLAAALLPASPVTKDGPPERPGPRRGSWEPSPFVDDESSRARMGA